MAIELGVNVDWERRVNISMFYIMNGLVKLYYIFSM